MSGEANSLDAALDAGFGGGEEMDTSSVGAPETGDVQATPQTQDTSTETQPDATGGESQDTRPRDASGKFTAPAAATAAVPKDAAKAPPAQVATKPGEAVTPAAPELKPPQNWKAAAREEWAKLPRHVQEEAKRVEVETMRVMRESADARKFAQNFERTLTPYRAFITDEPLKVVNNLLQTAVALQTAPPSDKAQLVAHIIRNYNVDIETLDKLLAEQAPQDAHPQAQPQARHPQQPAQFRDPRLDEWLAREQHEKARAAQQTVQAFAREAEFLDEAWPGKVRADGSPVLVRDLVANLLDAASRDGIDLTLKEAYAQVVQQHPDVSKVLRQREEAQRAATAQAATQRVRAASSSVRSQPASRPNGAQRPNLDTILDDAFSTASGR